MTHSLTYGSLTLTGDQSFADPTHHYWFEVAADGTEFGSPDAVTRIVTSLLSDGDIVAYDRDGNRTIPVKVMVKGPTLGSVAQGEAALRRESKVSNLLTWQPPDTFAPTSVYETFPSSMPRSYDAGWDLDEKSGFGRAFTLTLTCAPFARSAELTTVPALPAVTATTTTITNADTTTGWTGSASFYGGTTGSPTPTDQGAYVRVGITSSPLPLIGIRAIFTTTAVSMATTPYLLVEVGVQTTSPGTVSFFATLGGVATELPVVQSRVTTTGTTLYVLDTAGGSLTQILVAVAAAPGGTIGPSRIDVHDVSRTNVVPQITTRQFSRVLAVGGTERTPASIHIASPDGTSDIGLTIISTMPGKYPAAGFDPAMSRWYVSGTRTADATTVSGYRFRLDNGFLTSVAPASSFPEGGYQMSGLLASSVPGAYLVSSVVQTRKSGVTLKEWNNEEVVTLGPAPNWLLVDMGVPTLPILRAESGTDVVLSVRVLNVNGTVLAGPVVEAQDCWMLPVDDDCGLTVVQTDKAHLWLDSPTTTTGVPRVFEGDDATRAGSTYPLSGVSGGAHILSSGTTGLAVINSGAEKVVVEASYHKRWLHNAAEEG